MPPVEAGGFVQAALCEVGRPELAALIYTNRAGYPCVRWEELRGCPLPDDCAAVCKAFDLWYGGPQELIPDEAWWEGFSPAAVDAWYELALAKWTAQNCGGR